MEREGLGEGMNSKDKIKKIRYRIKYEEMEGIHTYHLCSCKRMRTRSGMCVLCLKDDLKAVMKGGLKL